MGPARCAVDRAQINLAVRHTASPLALPQPPERRVHPVGGPGFQLPLHARGLGPPLERGVLVEVELERSKNERGLLPAFGEDEARLRLREMLEVSRLWPLSRAEDGPTGQLKPARRGCLAGEREPARRVVRDRSAGQTVVTRDPPHGAVEHDRHRVRIRHRGLGGLARAGSRCADMEVVDPSLPPVLVVRIREAGAEAVIVLEEPQEKGSVHECLPPGDAQQRVLAALWEDGEHLPARLDLEDKVMPFPLADLVQARSLTRQERCASQSAAAQSRGDVFSLALRSGPKHGAGEVGVPAVVG